MPPKIAASVQEQVRYRANSLCEYCHTDETWQYVSFTIDHVIPFSAGGKHGIENLALACFHCNRHKSNTQTGLDEETKQPTPLFNPRKHHWPEHFVWSRNGLVIIPLTPIGRVTVATLDLNRERIQLIRSADMSIGRHPPFDDPVEPIG